MAFQPLIATHARGSGGMPPRNILYSNSSEMHSRPFWANFAYFCSHLFKYCYIYIVIIVVVINYKLNISLRAGHYHFFIVVQPKPLGQPINLKCTFDHYILNEFLLQNRK